LIVTGLVQEARIAAGPGMTVICSSSNPQQLRALLTVLTHRRSGRNQLRRRRRTGSQPEIGDVVVATEVLAGDAVGWPVLALNGRTDRQRRVWGADALSGWSRGVKRWIAAGP